MSRKRPRTTLPHNEDEATAQRVPAAVPRAPVGRRRTAADPPSIEELVAAAVVQGNEVMAVAVATAAAASAASAAVNLARDLANRRECHCVGNGHDNRDHHHHNNNNDSDNDDSDDDDDDDNNNNNDGAHHHSNNNNNNNDGAHHHHHNNTMDVDQQGGADVDDMLQLHVALVGDEWASRTGGISTANRMLAEGLAKRGVRVTMILPDVPLVRDDVRIAREKAESVPDKFDFIAKIEFCFVPVDDAFKTNDDGKVDAMAFDAALCATTSSMDIEEPLPHAVIGHAAITGRAAACLAYRWGAARVHFVHTMPEELALAHGEDGKIARGARKHATEASLIRGIADTCHPADLVLGFGPLLEKRWQPTVYPLGIPFHTLNPWLPRPRGDIKPLPESAQLLTIGRVSKFKQKNVLPPIAALTTIDQALWEKAGEPQYVLRGVKDGGWDMLSKEACDNAEHGVDCDRLGAVVPHAFTTDPEKIHADLMAAHVVLMPSIAEAFGLVAIEAVAAERVVVVGKDSGFAALLRATPQLLRFAEHLIIEDSPNGETMRLRWSAKLREFLKHVAGDEKAEWCTWGKELHNAYAKAFSLDAESQKFLVVLMKSIEEHRRKYPDHRAATTAEPVVVAPRDVVLPTVNFHPPAAAAYTPRDALEKKLDAMLHDAAMGDVTFVHIHGAGGSGKSMLARAAVQRLHGVSLVIEINAADHISLDHTLSDGSEAIRTATRSENEHKNALGVRDALEALRGEFWVLLVDNADGVEEKTLAHWLGMGDDGMSEALASDLAQSFERVGYDHPSAIFRDNVLEDLRETLQLRPGDMDKLKSARNTFRRLGTSTMATLDEVANHLPRVAGMQSRGVVVVTSRRRNVDKLYPEGAVMTMLEVKDMKKDEAMQLAATASGGSCDDEAMRRFVQACNCNALAITELGALVRRGTQTLNNVISRIHEVGDGHKWKLCAEAADKAENGALVMLEVFSVMAADDVPLDVIHHIGEPRAHEALIDYALVQFSPERVASSLHRVTAAHVRAGIRSKNTEKRRLCAAEAMLKVWPSDEEMQSSLPHLKRGLGLLPHGLEVLFQAKPSGKVSILGVCCGLTLTAAKYNIELAGRVWKHVADMFDELEMRGKWLFASSQHAHTVLLQDGAAKAVPMHQKVIDEMKENAGRLCAVDRDNIHLHYGMALRQKIKVEGEDDVEQTKENRTKAVEYLDEAAKSGDFLVRTRAWFNAGLNFKKLDDVQRGVELIGKAVEAWSGRYELGSPLIVEGRAVASESLVENKRVADAKRILRQLLETEETLRGETLNSLQTSRRLIQLEYEHPEDEEEKKAAPEKMEHIVNRFARVGERGAAADARRLAVQWKREMEECT